MSSASSQTVTTTSATPYCGDGVQQSLELCDDGTLNGKEGSNCTITCQMMTLASCGDGTIDAREECDDGNLRDDDGCTSLCMSERGFCGDGTVQHALNEECDAGSENGLPQSDCDARCRYVRLAACGDGSVNPETEMCDEGANNGNYFGSQCRTNCMLPRCGDGILDPNEECDDANNLSGDGCDKFCMYVRRGAPVAGGTTVPPPVRPYVPGQNPQNPEGTLPPGVQIPTPARTPTGPGLVIFLASGAAAGIGLARKRKNS